MRETPGEDNGVSLEAEVVIMRGVEAKLDRLGRDLDELKQIVLQQCPPKVKVSLKGILKGSRINRRDIEAAKRSLFPLARAK